VTTPARTSLDLGECLGVRELEQALARAKGAVWLRERRSAKWWSVIRRHHGARVLRLLLRDDEPAALTRSRAEELLLDVVRLAHLPPPEANARLLQYEVDFLWRGPRLVVEVDGRRFHGSARAFVEDRRRDAELVAAGYRVVRFTWQDLTRQREATLARLAQALVHESW
jgi:very-short-patch-repair endonuclease